MPGTFTLSSAGDIIINGTSDCVYEEEFGLRDGFRFSPDGRYLLYYAGRQGSSSSYLTRYPEIAGRWQVSTGTDVSAETFAPDGSAIYYTSEDQRQVAEESKAALVESGRFDRTIVVPVLPAKTFWPAEAYHQRYYQKKGIKGGCPIR